MSYIRPYPNGYKDFPDKTTPVTGAVLNAMDDALERIDREVSAGGAEVVNIAGLDRWKEASLKSTNGVATVQTLGDSIDWGVGSDGSSNEISGPYDAAQQAKYRTTAWPVQLRRILNGSLGIRDFGNNWSGIRSGWNSGAVISAGVTVSGTLGPFGQYSSGGAGGVSIPNGPDTVTWPVDSGLGPFTELDVFYWGSDSGAVSPGAPHVTVDGIAQPKPTGTVGGVLNRLRLTGFEDKVHEVVIGNDQSGLTVHTFAVVPRRGSVGFEVNRVARPGATVVDVVGTATAAAKTRMLVSSVGMADLLIVKFGTNDQTKQVPLADYSAKLQEIIDTQTDAGGSTLLLGAPPAAAPVGSLTEQMYRDAMSDLAQSNQHVAFTDLRDVFGTHAEGFARGLYPTNSTVHPSAKGAGLIARTVAGIILP